MRTVQCIWCETQPAGGFILDDLCPACEVRFAEISALDSTFAESDTTPEAARCKEIACAS